MKQGKTIQELAIELDRQNTAKRDFICPTKTIEVKPFTERMSELVDMDKPLAPAAADPSLARDARFALAVQDVGEAFPIDHFALRQMGERFKIPARYIDRLQKYPELVAHNINELFRREPKKQLVRTLDGRVRAFLSDRYMRIDNYDVAKMILEYIRDAGAGLVSAEVTEKRLYLKAMLPGMEAEIPPPPGVTMGQGHTMFVNNVQGGIVVSNSEIGAGSVSIQPVVVTKQCSNLAIFKDHGFARNHVGKQLQADGSGASELLSDETKALTDKAIIAQVKDIAKAALDGTAFKMIIDKLKETRSEGIEVRPDKCVEILADKKGLNETEADGIIGHLIRGGDLTKFGLHNAVTRHSQDVADYDRATELERLGGEIIELNKGDWNALSRAA